MRSSSSSSSSSTIIIIIISSSSTTIIYLQQQQQQRHQQHVAACHNAAVLRKGQLDQHKVRVEFRTYSIYILRSSELMKTFLVLQYCSDLSSPAASPTLPPAMKTHPKLHAHGVQGRYTAAELECLSNRPMKLREPPAWLLEPPPANPKCPVVEAAFGGSSGTLVPTSGAVDCTERYSTLLHCGGVSILLRRAEARAGPTIHHDYWWTVLRAAPLGGRIEGFGGNTTTLGPALRMSHNTAFMCAPDGQTVLAYGGRRKSLNGAFGFRDERDLTSRGAARGATGRRCEHLVEHAVACARRLSRFGLHRGALKCGHQLRVRRQALGRSMARAHSAVRACQRSRMRRAACADDLKRGRRA